MRMIAIRGLRFIIFFNLFFLFTVSIGMVYAKTQYVSDQLIITMREGKGNDFKIIQMLNAGTPLEIIEESQQYLKVRTQMGQEGWVLKQYITPERPKIEIIAGLEKEIDRLKTTLEIHKREKDALQEEFKKAKADYSAGITDLNKGIAASKEGAEKAAKELTKVSEKYNALVAKSKNIVEIVEERDGLKEVNHRLTTETEYLRKENSRLKGLQIIWWFLAGGGVFFVGWITGKVSRKKRSLAWD